MDGFDTVLKPIETAQGLPNACYTDPAMFSHESARLFTSDWAAIGFGFDAPQPGCVYPVTFLGIPLVMVRDRSGEIKVFENVCRHRGMILVDKAKRLSGPITCPYHAWAYDFDGQLRATPHVGGPDIHEHGSVDCSALSLNEVKSAVWRDVVYVNLSADAAPFAEKAAALKQRWAEFETKVHFGGSDSYFELEVACNWKLAVENYCEAYHLPFVHPDLNSYSRLEDHYNILDDTSYAGQGSHVYAPQISDDGRQFPAFDGLSAKWNKAAEYCAFFPNVLYGVHKDHAFAIVLVPTGQKTTTERIALYYADEAALGPDYAEMRAINAAMWKQVFVEDIGVVEGMQAGRMAPSYDGGKFSAVMDHPTHHFHQWVASRLT